MEQGENAVKECFERSAWIIAAEMDIG